MGLGPRISISTRYGPLSVQHVMDEVGRQGLVVVNEPLGDAPFVRVHSSCVFSESLGAVDCDCARQLDASLAHVGAHGGVVIYVWEEGRGIGIEGKMRAIALEETEGLNTAEAFRRLGHDPDPRTYQLAITALRELGIGPHIRLSTRNPRKQDAFTASGFKIVKRVRLTHDTNPEMDDYLRRKDDALGHHDD